MLTLIALINNHMSMPLVCQSPSRSPAIAPSTCEPYTATPKILVYQR